MLQPGKVRPWPVEDCNGNPVYPPVLTSYRRYCLGRQWSAPTRQTSLPFMLQPGKVRPWQQGVDIKQKDLKLTADSNWHSLANIGLAIFTDFYLLHTTAWNKQLSKACCTVQEGILPYQKANAACGKAYIPIKTYKTYGGV